jgi:Tol biopolymer transport system component
VIGVEGRKSRRITTESSTEVNPRSSRDGKWIYFSSSRTGRHEGWKIPADGIGAAVQLTRNGGWRLDETFDGQFLYFDKYERDVTGIFRMPIEGGDERLFLDTPRGNWTLARGGIYYDDIPARTFHFFDFASGQAKQIAALEKLNTGVGATPSVSGDERWLIYTNYDQTISDIMLVENFR